jgi:diacylglycerol kinase
MRIHLVATCYIFWIGCLAELSRTALALITLCCGLVMGLELVNTSLETLCDRVTTDRDEQIRIAKDTAAGGVLLAAIASVVVAVWLLGDWVVSGGLQSCIRTHPVMDGVFLTSLIPAAVFAFGKKIT